MSPLLRKPSLFFVSSALSLPVLFASSLDPIRTTFIARAAQCPGGDPPQWCSQSVRACVAARGSTPKRTTSGEEKKRNAALRLPLAARYAEEEGDRERELPMAASEREIATAVQVVRVLLYH